jgi:hypothetical protein
LFAGAKAKACEDNRSAPNADNNLMVVVVFMLKVLGTL